MPSSRRIARYSEMLHIGGGLRAARPNIHDISIMK